MCCEQGDELRPAGKRAKFLANVMLLGKGLEFMSRKN